MFNRIPLAAAGGETRDRDPQAVGMAEGVLERLFPGAGPTAVAPPLSARMTSRRAWG